MRRVIGWILLFLALLGAASVTAVLWMTRMPGRPHPAELPPLTAEEADVRERIAAHVAVLGGEIGERNPRRPSHLELARTYLRDRLVELGYEVREDPFLVGGIEVSNLEAVLPGAGSGCVVVGAHYDSVPGTPGADDNASGVAVVLELARLLSRELPLRDPSRSEVRFVFFTNEEQPFFGTEDMGSLRYARALRADQVAVTAMLSLETVGYYTDEPGTQHYPSLLAPFYPDTGNFIAFVSNLGSRSILRRAVGVFRTRASLPSQGGALPGSLTGVGWSDHWSFWEAGYPALMVTDTAFFRYPMYHGPEDLPREVDVSRVARLTVGLIPVLEALGSSHP